VPAPMIVDALIDQSGLDVKEKTQGAEIDILIYDFKW
jgi:hypothetical protein